VSVSIRLSVNFSFEFLHLNVGSYVSDCWTLRGKGISVEILTSDYSCTLIWLVIHFR